VPGNWLKTSVAEAIGSFALSIERAPSLPVAERGGRAPEEERREV
jgi:hypothetical protein